MGTLLESNAIIWLGIAILLLIIEAVTVNLVTIWFGVGAIFAMIASLLGLEIGWQLTIFVVATLILLIYTRPIVKKFVKKTPTNADRLIGMRAIVVEAINNIEGIGQVKVAGSIWSARSEDNSLMEVGQQVDVKSISGVRLIVK